MAEYIERAKAAEFFEKNKQVMWHKDDVAATVSSKNIPAADVVEVVHGKWVKKTADCVYYYACSECEEPVLKSRWGHDCFTRYCPNCGARMDGDRNETQ